MSETLRKIPSVDALLRSAPGKRAARTLGRPLLKAAVVGAIGEVREGAARGEDPPSDDAILARAVAAATRVARGLTPAINATGVILHTGLGRAPLPESAIAAAAAAGAYSDLEVDRESGRRGKRSTRAEIALTAITGAEAALVVNNNAAALLLALAALAVRKEVLVSRGELIEIGGEFRLPDIMAASGAKLVEVGTTNRTRRTDYERAASAKTALILKVHPSNYRVVGFQQSPDVAQLSQVARRAGVPLLFDIGSGLLEGADGLTPDEPDAVTSLAQGADLVFFSGDKLLGGPQAGIVLGRADLVDRMRAHPVARAVRVDKMQIAALEAVLAEYANDRRAGLPVWHMIEEPAPKVKERAQELARTLGGDLEGARVRACESSVGGGSLPGHPIPSFGVELATTDADAFAAVLRTGNPPIFCRVEDGAVLLDLRTVPAEDLPRLARAISYAMENDDGRADG